MYKHYLLCVLQFIVYNAVNTKTIYLDLLDNVPTAAEIAFLEKYGYLPDVPGGVDVGYTPQSLSEAVKKMQAFAGLPQTGTIDADTKALFTKKRCGVKDRDSTSRSRRYIVQQGWDKKDLTYRVLNGASTLDKPTIEVTLAAALAMWAPYGGLRFTKISEKPADIEMSFGSREHGDGFPFDGPGRVVAHAFPPTQGAVHFDDDEVWTNDPEDETEDATDLFAVAVHEIGHTLGLAHSSVKTSVMYPYYQVPVEKLYDDDIQAMHELYSQNGVPESGPEEATDDPTLASSSLAPRFTKAASDELDDYIPDICLTNYDTIQVIHGNILVFEEEWVWVLRDRNILEQGYPRKFRELFAGLPPDVTTIKTIYERRNGNVVIFSGRKLWEFDTDFHLSRTGNISEYSLPPEVSTLTTVFISNYNNKTYLIDETRFWRYDEATQQMDKGYPKDMSAWREIPNPVDAAIIWKEDTFFFQGGRFWRFDNTMIKAHPYYPLPIAPIWFKCPFTPDMDKYATAYV